MVDCEAHYEVIIIRDGRHRNEHQDAISRIEWGRILDDVSEARVVYQRRSLSGDCVELLSRVDSYADSIEIRRNDEVVWSGVIVDVDYGRNDIILECKDELVFARKRELSEDYSTVEKIDTAIHVANIWDMVMKPDPRPVTVMISETGVMESRDASDSTERSRYAFFVMQEMLETSVDMFMYGTELHIGYLDDLFAPLHLHAEDMFGDVRLRKAGEWYRGQVIVYGDGDVKAVYPDGFIAGSYYPLVQDVIYDSEIADYDSALAAAKARYAYADGGVPWVIKADSAIELRSGSFDINSLLPARTVTVPLDTLGFDFRQAFKLSELNVVVDSRETVSISLQPVGSIAALSSTDGA